MKCRICNGDFFEEPIISLENMPKSAQGFLDYKSDDQTIDLNLVQCKYCGTVQLDCEPVEYYKDVIRFGGDLFSEIRYKQLSSFINKYNLNNKKIIEIGAGRGEFFKVLKEFDVDAYAIENSIDNINEAKKLGLEIEKCFLETENTKIKGGPFDAFVQFNFLEHQPDPNTMIRAIYNNLKENGIGLLTVPCFEYIQNKGTFYELITDHLIYFTKETLEYFLHKNGFKIIEYNLEHDTHNVVLQKINYIDTKKLYLCFKDLRSHILDFLDNNIKIAVWGASHHAFTILSTYKIGNRIEYIIDSSKYKQNKYSIGSNIKIISPEEAYKNMVDAIIIMAPNHSNEIIDIIRKNIDSKVKIATIVENEFIIIR